MERGYEHDMRRARARIAAVPSESLDTRFGPVEYAVQGVGLPLLVAHGVLGCHADGVEGWWSNLTRPGFRVISPSRFGYFGSALPRDACLTVPTLVIHAKDDPLAPYAFATVAARRIPDARLVTIERGGHLFLGNDHEVRKEIHAFVESVQRPRAMPRAWRDFRPARLATKVPTNRMGEPTS